MSESVHANTNRLINEKSPYLLQHAHNPVDWYPWGEEAFNKAKKEDKPIFLSVGYSTCHWCHVMEDESFSNPEIANIMNQYFISIKVDREERPDIDNIYMTIVQAMTGSGGWPLTVFLTPDRKPFYGGTYFPPEDRWGMSGLKTVLNSIADVWKNRRDEVLRSSESLVQAIQEQAGLRSKETFALNEETFKKAYTQFSQRFDSSYGGFGAAPKFPTAHSLSFLLRYWKRTGESKSLEMVEKTLNSMAKGGIYDHLGGGFHRYSTDKEWRVPHFEKMLYDQAIISNTYLEAYQATGKQEYAQTAREIFEYVLRDMTSPNGGFYSAEDADSPLPHDLSVKKEGAFYLWDKGEIIDILGKEEAERFFNHYAVDPKENILYIPHSPQDEKLGELKKKLFVARSKRPRPHLDDKILVDWNGLMISSLSLGSRVLNEPRYRDAAEKSAKFIFRTLIKEDGKLLRRHREGESAIAGTIEDYSFFIHGLFDLYEATFNPEYLKEAKHLTNEMIRLFWDEKNGGFFFTADDAEKLIVRQKEIYDGAIPSGNSIAALDLIRLARLTMDKEFEVKAQALLNAFSAEITQNSNAYSQMLIAIDFALGPSKEIVVSGDEKSKDTKEMILTIYKRFIPNKVVAFLPADPKEAEAVISLVPFLKGQIPIDGKSTAYVCKNYVCQIPVTSIEKMNELLEE